jgi:hypothetical protein
MSASITTVAMKIFRWKCFPSTAAGEASFHAGHVCMWSSYEKSVAASSKVS